MTTDSLDTTLGDLLSALYEAALETYGDPELAEVAASAMLNDLLLEASAVDDQRAAAA